jgi:hypothetical protein
MRTLRLVRIAAQAEGVRLREQARRSMVRAMLGVVAMVFLAAAVVFAHAAGWYWLRRYWTELDTALAMAGADIVIAALLLVLAARSSPGRLEREALAVRRQAWDSAAGSVAVSALVMQLLRQVMNAVLRNPRR